MTRSGGAQFQPCTAKKDRLEAFLGGRTSRIEATNRLLITLHLLTSLLSYSQAQEPVNNSGYTIVVNNGPSHPASQPCHPGKSCICGFSHVGLEQHIAWHPYVTVSDHFQIALQDRDVPAVIRVTFTVSVTAVNCTVT